MNATLDHLAQLFSVPRAPRVIGVHRVPADSEAGRRFQTSTNPGNQSTGHGEQPGCKAAQRRLRQLERAKAKAAAKLDRIMGEQSADAELQRRFIDRLDRSA